MISRVYLFSTCLYTCHGLKNRFRKICPSSFLTIHLSLVSSSSCKKTCLAKHARSERLLVLAREGGRSNERRSQTYTHCPIWRWQYDLWSTMPATASLAASIASMDLRQQNLRSVSVFLTAMTSGEESRKKTVRGKYHDYFSNCE